jgi:hypothetical protein
LSKDSAAAVHHLASKGHDQGHGHGPIGVVIAVIVIGLLAVGALIRTRRLTRAR